MKEEIKQFLKQKHLTISAESGVLLKSVRRINNF